MVEQLASLCGLEVQLFMEPREVFALHSKLKTQTRDASRREHCAILAEALMMIHHRRPESSSKFAVEQFRSGGHHLQRNHSQSVGQFH